MKFIVSDYDSCCRYAAAKTYFTFPLGIQAIVTFDFLPTFLKSKSNRLADATTFPEVLLFATYPGPYFFIKFDMLIGFMVVAPLYRMSERDANRPLSNSVALASHGKK